MFQRKPPSGFANAAPANGSWDCRYGRHLVTTTAVVLRPLELGEIDEYSSLLDDVVRTNNGYPSTWRSPAEQLVGLDGRQRRRASKSLLLSLSGPRRLAIVEQPPPSSTCSAGRLAGAIELWPVDGQPNALAEMGYWLGAEFRGRGVGTAALDAMSRFAFAHLGITCIVAATNLDNSAARRSFEKAEFTEYARAPRTLPNGQIIDAVYVERRSPDPRASTCPAD